jgi:hypothetical protein
MGAPFPITPELTAIAIAYTNGRMISDFVMPRVPVGAEEFKYWKYDLSEGFTVPDTKVGRKSQPNEVEFTATEETASTDDYGLDDPIPYSDILNSPGNYDPVSRAVEGIINYVTLAREVRVANMVFNADNYATANKVTLSGTSQWSDFDNSDPALAIIEAFDTMVMRPTEGVIGRAVATKLATHPKIVKAYHGNAGDSGIVPMAFVADLLELEALHVGEAFINTAKKGQAASLARAWGKHAVFYHKDPLADTRGGTTFGLTGEFGGRIAGQEDDSSIGLRGGIRVRAGESVKELITANDLGYMFVNAVA